MTCRAGSPVTAVSFTDTNRSPAETPALAAGLLGSTVCTVGRPSTSSTMIPSPPSCPLS